MMLKAPFDLSEIQPEAKKSEYKQSCQQKLASLRTERYSGRMSADTYAIYRYAYLMSLEDAQQWHGGSDSDR